MYIIIATYLQRNHMQKDLDTSIIKIDLGRKPIFIKHKTMIVEREDVILSFFMCYMRDIVSTQQRFCEDDGELLL